MTGEELILREMKFKKDYDQLVELYDIVFENELSNMGQSATQVLKEIKAILPFMKFMGIFSKKYRHILDGYVYTHDSKIIAVTTVSTWNMKDWEIAMVATDPEYRRRGLGRKLVNESIEHAKKYKAKMCYLEVLHDNVPAYDLDSNLGFVKYDSVAKYLLELNNLPEERQEEKIPVEFYGELVKKEKALLLDIFEEVFDHKSFTGRSGTFFGYEGLGSIYWHMVSKLLLAVQETYQRAIDNKESEEVIKKLSIHYPGEEHPLLFYRVRAVRL